VGIFQTILQLLFIALMLGIMSLFALNLALAWAWAQSEALSENKNFSFSEVLSTAAVEWSAQLILAIGHLRPPQIFLEAPPLDAPSSSTKAFRKQLPIIFVPSLHTGSGIYSLSIWRLKRHHFTSLWPFSWKPFLRDRILLEDELVQFILKMLDQTKSPRFRLVSFGSSRPVVASALSRPELLERCEKWIAISAPETAGPAMRFLLTPRTKSCYLTDTAKASRQPDFQLCGTHDIYAYPSANFGDSPKEWIEPVGHYSLMIHPAVIQKSLEEMGATRSEL
jgi:hypothetical protein